MGLGSKMNHTQFMLRVYSYAIIKLHHVPKTLLTRLLVVENVGLKFKTVISSKLSTKSSAKYQSTN